MSTENLDLPHLMDLDVDCVMGHVSTEQIELFNHRNNVETNELTLYFVRSTNRPLNGCASHPIHQSIGIIYMSEAKYVP
ncbi:hypothetical protein ACT453_23425, partial [Bacillus sp. D-CC]